MQTQPRLLAILRYRHLAAGHPPPPSLDSWKGVPGVRVGNGVCGNLGAETLTLEGGQKELTLQPRHPSVSHLLLNT